MGAKLERVVSCDELLRDAIGKYTAGEGFLIWCNKPELCGISLWGRLSLHDLDLLTRVYDRGVESGVTVPCDFLFDARRLEGLEHGAFEILARDAASRLGDLKRRLRRQAFLRNSGLMGAAMSGFYSFLDAELESRVFTDIREAFIWLGETDESLSELLEDLVAEAISGSALVDKFRHHVVAHLGERMTLRDAARALAISPRSLQRHLHEAGTTFRAGLDDARLVAAQKLLLDSGLKIAAIANQIGTSTEANFISFFRRKTGVSPAEWRRQGSAVAAVSSDDAQAGVRDGGRTQ